MIDRVHFVTDTCRFYDCYIRDNGCSNELTGDANWIILVAGVKPWELQHTMRSLRSLAGKAAVVMLSFAEASICQELKVLFGRSISGQAPWIPDPWHPSSADLTIFDKLLRSKIEYFCENEKECDINVLKIDSGNRNWQAEGV